MFVQDDWRATVVADAEPRRPLRRVHAAHRGGEQLSNFDLATPKILVAGQNGVSDSAGVTTDYSNIAPRLGFSATLPQPDGGARRLRPGLLPGQLHVAVVHEEPAVRRHLWPGD